MRIYFNLLMKQNPRQNNDVGNLPNAELLIRAGEKFIDLQTNQTVLTSQVGVDSTLTASCYNSVCVAISLIFLVDQYLHSRGDDEKNSGD